MNPLEQAAIYRNTREEPARRHQEIAPRSDKAAGRKYAPRVGSPGVCLECLSRICDHVIPPRSRVLAPRQAEMLSLLSRGLCNKEISAIMGLTEGTVKAYLHDIFKILGFTSRLEAALWARDHADLLLTEKTSSA